MAVRGVLVSYETVRRWCEKFGHLYAAGLRKGGSGPAIKRHLDEVFLKINGVRHYLWRDVDQNGVIIDTGAGKAPSICRNASSVSCCGPVDAVVHGSS